MLSVANTYAQTAGKILLKGRIIGSKDKLPVIGATVVEQDQDKRVVNGMATNLDGEFALTVSDVNHKLVVSIIGYKTASFSIGTRRVFNITLDETSNELTEVNVVAQAQVGNGTGLNIDKRDLTTSTVTLNAKDVEDLAATSIDQAIQGRLPGVDIVSNSGDPGAGMSIKIRGTTSINGVSNPLVVVDGVPYNTSVPSNFNFATADNSQYADLLGIAPSDIATISILKDAAATAVWGSKAANGVLLLTTKRGRKGSPSIAYSFKGTSQVQPSGIPLLTGDEYSSFIPEEFMNVTGVPLNTQSAKEFEYDPLDPYYYNNYGQNTDWIAAITRKGLQLDNNLSLTGGGDKASYYASVGYTKQTGTTVGTDLARLNTRLNLDYSVSDKIHFTTFFSYSHSKTLALYGQPGDVRSTAQTKMPNSSIYEYDEYGRLTPNFFSPASNVQGQYPGTYNPVAMALAASDVTLSDRITPHFNLRYNITNTLQLNSDITFDISNGRDGSFLPQIASGRPFTETNVNRTTTSDYDTYAVLTKTSLIITPNLGDKNSFQGLVQVSSEDDRQTSQSATTSNTASSSIMDASAPARTASSGLSIGSNLLQSRTVSALINGQYKLLDRYIVNVGLRIDGDSRFGPGKRYGYFPEVSVRYRLSGEEFMKKFSDWLDDFSFRASYGHSGSAPSKPNDGNYLFYSNYLSTSTNYLGLAGLAPSTPRLDNLRWETLKSSDAGVSFVMFKNRLNVDVDFYRTRISDLLTDIDLASYTGFSDVLLNVGTLDNQGFEVFLQSTPYKSKKLNIDFAFNISNNINALRSISPYFATQTGDVTTNGNYLQVLQLNNPLGSFYGYKFKGVYKDADATVARDGSGAKIISPDGTPVQMRFNYPTTDYLFQPGDAQYEDINHDGNINYQDVVYLGNGSPKFTGGFGPTFTYKGSITLSAYFNYRLGGQVINQAKMRTSNEYSYDNQSTAVLHRWRVPGDVTDVPRALYGTGYNWLGSSRYVESSTFLRFQSITARYTFNKSVASRIKAKSLSVYFTGQNILTFTNYTGQDPEIGQGSGIYQIAVDKAVTPPLKQYTIGLSASF